MPTFEGLPKSVVAAVQTIAITGGKGGVGKSTVAINLAAAMAARGRRTLLLDGDLGLANVDVLLGLTPRRTLAHVLAGECSLDDVRLEAHGFGVIPAASGIARLAALGDIEHLNLVRAFSDLAMQVDTLIVDTAAGIGPGVLRLVQAAQHVLIVVCDEPASITDAYAVIKVLSRDFGLRRFKVLANMVRSSESGANLFATLNQVAGRFLDVILEFAGEVPEDPYLRRAIREQRPVLTAYPTSRASRALKNLADTADSWPIPAGPRGHIEFFAERLLQRQPVKLEVVR